MARLLSLHRVPPRHPRAVLRQALSPDFQRRWQLAWEHARWICNRRLILVRLREELAGLRNELRAIAEELEEIVSSRSFDRPSMFT